MGLPDPAAVDALTSSLKDLEGVKAVAVVAGNPVVVARYDITRTGYRSTGIALAAAGLAPPDDCWHHRKAAWFQGLDLTGRENAVLKAPACCSKPPRSTGGPGGD